MWSSSWPTKTIVDLSRLITAIENAPPMFVHPNNLAAELTDPNSFVNNSEKRKQVEAQIQNQMALEHIINGEIVNQLLKTKQHLEHVENEIIKLEAEEKKCRDEYYEWLIRLNGMLATEEEEAEKRKLEEEIEAELAHIDSMIKTLNQLNQQITTLRARYEELEKRNNELRAEIERERIAYDERRMALMDMHAEMALNTYRNIVDEEQDPIKKQEKLARYMGLEKAYKEARASNDPEKIGQALEKIFQTNLNDLKPAQKKDYEESCHSYKKQSELLFAEFQQKVSKHEIEIAKNTSEMIETNKKIDKLESTVSVLKKEVQAKVANHDQIEKHVDNIENKSKLDNPPEC